jgi:hypothetical protein
MATLRALAPYCHLLRDSTDARRLKYVIISGKSGVGATHGEAATAIYDFEAKLAARQADEEQP